MLFGPGIYEAVLEMSAIVQLTSFWGASLPQDLLFKAQDSVMAGGMGHGVYFLPSSCGFHRCKNTVRALVGL